MAKSAAERTLAWRQRHKEQVKKCTAARAARNQAIIRAAKAVPCADCNIQYPHWIMEFDHVPGRDKKRFTIGSQYAIYCTEAVLREIAKCDVVCKNCHATRTYTRGYSGVAKKA